MSCHQATLAEHSYLQRRRGPPPRLSAGHEKAAAAILSAAGLDGLGNDGLKDPCTRFGVEA
jgi:hypothetical protein